MSAIAVNGITLWVQAPNLTPDLFIKPLVFLQTTFGTWLLLTSSHSLPRLSHTPSLPQTARRACDFLCFRACLPISTFHALLSTQHPKRSLKTINRIVAHPCSKPVMAFHYLQSNLNSSPQLPSSTWPGPCFSPGSFPTIWHCHKVASCFRAFAPAASLPQKASPQSVAWFAPWIPVSIPMSLKRGLPDLHVENNTLWPLAYFHPLHKHLPLTKVMSPIHYFICAYFSLH